MSTESTYNAGLHSVHEVNTNPRMQQQQQQAQLLFRQRQLQQQQQQQRTLPPTPTLSSQGSPAFSQLAQVIPSSLPVKPIMTTTEQRTSSMGQAVLRLLQFRDQLSPGDQAKDLNFWKSFVDDFFTSTATMKIGLLENNTQQRIEFDITQNLIARLFYTHYQCSLDSIQLTTDQTMEYFLPNGMMLECPRSSLIHRYNNGTMIILSGELSVLFHLDPTDGVLKIHQWKFICNQHDEYIARSKLVSVDTNAVSKKKLKLTSKTPTFHTPSTLVSNWGIPDRIMELLRMIDISNRISEVAFFSLVTGLNPKDSLSAMSFNINQKMACLYPEDQKQSQVQQQSQAQVQQQQQSQVHVQPQLQQQQPQQKQLPQQPQLQRPQLQQQHLQQQHQQHQLQHQQPQPQKQQSKQEPLPQSTQDMLSSPLITTDILSSLLPSSSDTTYNPDASTPTPTMIPGSIMNPHMTPMMMNIPGTIPPNMNPQQYMQQQQHMQRYYQQHTLRIQQQQQALQLQQRQAMQRLQPPQMEPHIPLDLARKRKLSIQKDKKLPTKKSKKP